MRWVGIAAIALVVGALLVGTRHEAPIATMRAARSAPSARHETPALPLALPPTSLAGTEVDGAPSADADGELVVTPELRRFFEYFFTASGEEPDAVIRARIEAALEERLPPRAARRAREILARFLAYRDAARGLRPVSDDLGARLAAVRALRRDTLGGDVADALFGDEERADDAALERRRARAETPGDRDAVDLAAGGEVTAPVATLRRETELRAAGADVSEIRALRVGAFGADGADRLEALDRARDAWNARLEAFRAQRADGRDGEALLAESFTPEEQVRVRALEGIAGHPIP